MRLEHVCDMELAYREEPAYEGKVLLVRPYGGKARIILGVLVAPKARLGKQTHA
jgi:hypothetical protein